MAIHDGQDSSSKTGAELCCMSGHTMQRDQHSDRPPDPPPSRMSAHAKHEREARYRGKPDAQLGKVPRGAPHSAEEVVLLLAAVGDARGEGAALVVGVGHARAVGEAGHGDDLALAAREEAVLHGDLGVEYLGVVHDQPACLGGMQGLLDASAERRRLANQSGRMVENMFCGQGCGVRLCTNQESLDGQTKVSVIATAKKAIT